jgi:hypothetical protein
MTGRSISGLWWRTATAVIARTTVPVEIQLWRPDDPNSILPGGFYGGVGRKR